MAGRKTYDPYETWKYWMNSWEKQANEAIQFWTNRSSFVRFSQGAGDLRLRYLERLQKNQQLLVNQLQLPTKQELANAAKLTVQTEEKLEALEEQLWNVEDSIESANKKVDILTAASDKISKQINQLKTEQQQDIKERQQIDEIHFELLELKRELAEMNSLKEEIASLKALLAENHVIKERELAPLSK